jgi:hypothetical protein
MPPFVSSKGFVDPEDHPNQAQLTPEYVLTAVRRILGTIELDPCTEPDNPVGAERFYTPPADWSSYAREPPTQ